MGLWGTCSPLELGDVHQFGNFYLHISLSEMLGIVLCCISSQFRFPVYFIYVQIYIGLKVGPGRQGQRPGTR